MMDTRTPITVTWSDRTCYELDLYLSGWMAIIVKEAEWIPAIIEKINKSLKKATKIKAT